MKWTYGLVFLLSNFLFSQNLDYNNGYESVRICTAIQGNNFVSEKSADEALTRILSVIGASKRFVLQECSNINNAVALTFNGVRYIMYDPEFMSELKYSSDWTNMFILAHEVGHHINGHSVDVILSSNGMGEETSLSTKRIQELETTNEKLESNLKRAKARNAILESMLRRALNPVVEAISSSDTDIMDDNVVKETSMIMEGSGES